MDEPDFSQEFGRGKIFSGLCCCRIAESVAMSGIVLAKGLKQANSGAPACRPVVSTLPEVSLRAHQVALAAGIVMEPSNTVPMDIRKARRHSHGTI